MILDALSASARYQSLHPHFAAAFAWSSSDEVETIANGRYPLIGEQLLVIVETGQTLASERKRFESHRRYIDIQVNLAGSEIMEWMPAAALQVSDDFTSDGDIRFYHQPERPATRLLVQPRHFAIFYPEDAHKPCCHPGAAPVAYRKLVFKVELTLTR
jgi:YhcH/YjgK/YiaL family protein